MDVIIHGADSETYHGEPHTLQFMSNDTDYETCIWTDADTATDGFLDWAESLQSKVKHVVYCHNLDFDLPEFLWSVKDQLISIGGDYRIEYDGWLIHGVYGRPTFCHMRHEKKHITVLIVDSYYWYKGSLEKAAELFCPDLPKLKRPKDLGTRKFSMQDQEFYDYAIRDAEIAYNIGKAVQGIIREFDLTQPVSLADMSAKIFRHHYLRHTIPQPSNIAMKGALASYHGGKNNVLPDACPGWHLGITAMDISSAYPYAMSQLPSMSFKELYKRYPLARSPRIKQVPELGVYQVSGTADSCKWPCLFTHNFKPIQGKFLRTWIQGYELNEALDSGEVKIDTIRGHYYESENDNRPSPFKAFCDEFYKRKESEPDPVLRYMYKIILNSVYGKFIQTRKNSRIMYTDVDSLETAETHDLVAGGMFHPFIASAITAHTRAYIHQLEHAHQAIHTATDGIFTKKKKPIRVPLSPKGKGLGAVTIEQANADAVILRNKCYILYAADGKTKSQYFKGKRIAKYAKHGFQGTIYDLEKLVAQNRRKYTASRPNRLREALKRGLTVNEFVEREYTLKIGPITVKN